jgi:hypothetical protein
MMKKSSSPSQIASDRGSVNDLGFKGEEALRVSLSS